MNGWQLPSSGLVSRGQGSLYWLYPPAWMMRGPVQLLNNPHFGATPTAQPRGADCRGARTCVSWRWRAPMATTACSARPFHALCAARRRHGPPRMAYRLFAIELPRCRDSAHTARAGALLRGVEASGVTTGARRTRSIRHRRRPLSLDSALLSDHS